jgi:hypothetical protein
MALRMDKPWRALDAATVAGLPGQLGIYQIADAEGRVLYIGYAGGRSLFGLRSKLREELDQGLDDATQFRVEITMQYMTRYLELLMVHKADHGVLPRGNENAPPPRLGRLSPV